MNVKIARAAAAAALAAALVIPAAALAADPEPAVPPGPPAAVTEWQGHLEHMRSLHGSVGAHVGACLETHGSMAGMLGPNGAMVEMMAGGMMR